ELLGIDAGADDDVELFGLLLDLQGRELLLTKAVVHRFFVVGFHDPLAGLAGAGACFPNELGHLAPEAPGRDHGLLPRRHMSRSRISVAVAARNGQKAALVSSIPFPVAM